MNTARDHVVRKMFADDPHLAAPCAVCARPGGYRCSYRYTTGKAARVITAHRIYCEEHARSFARSAGIPFTGQLELLARPE